MQSNVFLVLCNMLTAPVAVAVGANRVVPRPLVGRWDTVWNCINRALAVGPLNLGLAIAEAAEMDKAKAKPRPASAAASAAGADKIATEELKEMSEKLGRYRKAACEACGDWAFTWISKVAQRLINHLSHFYHAVLRLPQGDETHLSLARLTCGGAQKLLDGFAKLLDRTAWEDLMENVPLDHLVRCSDESDKRKLT